MKPSHFRVLLVFVICALSFSQVSAAVVRCGLIFSPYEESWIQRSIPMNPQYRGENRGLYVDPIMKVPWMVKYFKNKERRQFELTERNGLLWDVQGEKADSVYDGNALHFQSSLIVITKDREIFVMPFEERGKYHHSSLSRGENVLFAGTATFSAGRIRSLSDQSGHYKPDGFQSLLALRTLYLMGVDLSQMRLEGNVVIQHFKTYSMTPAEVRNKLNLLFENREIDQKEVEALLQK